ncbi:hypothetical protein F2Q69_00063538 [Brassica cretica]|uniref:Katanin p80 subunit C-terminal domain-containing protein n=1 Tax=Brassica cretica TaxID=69181 RepID=A0A8S9RGK9_BRACR|nr:hypothetical protein F2Q69_00063538 [Brassica cretica]
MDLPEIPHFRKKDLPPPRNNNHDSTALSSTTTPPSPNNYDIHDSIAPLSTTVPLPSNCDYGLFGVVPANSDQEPKESQPPETPQTQPDVPHQTEETMEEEPVLFVPSMGAWTKPLVLKFPPPCTPSEPSTPCSYDPQLVQSQIEKFWPSLEKSINLTKKKSSLKVPSPPNLPRQDLLHAKISQSGSAPAVDHSYKALMAQVVYKEEGTLEQAALSTLPSKVRIVLVLLPWSLRFGEEHLVVFEESQEADSLLATEELWLTKEQWSHGCCCGEAANLSFGNEVYSWEPVICRDSVDLGWSTLGDMCINENKFVGCSYYRNSVGIWVSDISKLEPYGAGSEDENECMVKRFSALDEQASERMKSGSRGSSSPDYETKEIKNIYVDSIGGNLKAAIRKSEKQNANDKSSRMHSVVDSDSEEESSHSRSESVASSKTSPGMMLRPAHVRKTLAKFEESASVHSGTRKKSSQDVEEETQTRNAEDSTIKGIMYKFEKALSSEPPADEATRMLHKPPRVQRSSYNNNYNESRRAMSVDSATSNDSKGGMEYSGDLQASRILCKDINSQHIVTKTERVVSPEKPGDEQTSKTRSLVERFERGEKITHTEEADNTNAVEQDPHKTSRQTGETPVVVSTRRARSTPARVMPIVLNRDSNIKSDESPSTQPARTSSVPMILNQSTNDEPSVTLTQSRTSPARTLPLTLNQATHIVMSRRPRRTSSARVRPVSLSQAVSMTSHECSVTSTRPDRTSPPRVMPTKLNQTDDMASDTSHITSRRRTSPTQMLATPTEIDNLVDMAQDETHVPSQTDSDITENLMQTHEEFLSTLQSRLTKLQIVRHFWERSDVKGAIGALRKLTDQSVQADVISILTDKIEILTLDMFSQLVPVLTSLLGSRTERPVNVSLDMLLKLVAVFGTVIRSTVSAPRIVGVDLHADEREVKGITMQDTNLPSLFCGTAQDSKDSANSRKKRRSNNKKGSRTKPCSSTNIATCKANNDHGAALQVLVN